LYDIPDVLAENGGSPPYSFSPSAGYDTFFWFARAAALSPNLANLPYQVDFPLDSNGKLVDSVWTKWLLHMPSRLAATLPPNSDLAIYFDFGRQDEQTPFSTNVAFADSLNKLGINYKFLPFTGGHTDKFESRLPISLAFLNSVMFSLPNVCYSAYIIDDSLGNNNGTADAGEAVSLIITLVNKYVDVDATGVSATLTIDDPDVQLIKSSANFGNIATNQSSTNENNPFTFSVNPSSGAHLSTFQLNITADGGYARTDSLELIIGSPTVLVVDDDAGRSYETHFTKHILYPEVWEAGWPNCPSLEYLKKFKAVIWFTGNDQKFTITKVDQDTIAAFLDGGGKLLITGQNIGYDLTEDGSATDSTFFANYLHANYVSNQTNDKIVAGVSGDPITDGLAVSFMGTYGGAGNQESPDIIDPIPPAETIMKYSPSFSGAGLRYENKTTGARLIYLAFGFEGIAGPNENSAKQLLDKAVAWLKGELPTAVENKTLEPALSKSYTLRQNYPNPFNAQTLIEYQLPQSGHVRLVIHNLLGQKICTLVDLTLQPGLYRAVWDGKDSAGRIVPSGVYFYRLEAENFSEVKKMLFLQ